MKRLIMFITAPLRRIAGSLEQAYNDAACRDATRGHHQPGPLTDSTGLALCNICGRRTGVKW